MPITSQQMSGMIGGQQAMFGNFASYAQQISPGFQGAPTYPNPMAGAGGGFAPPPAPMHNPTTMDVGPQAMSAIGNIGLPALGTAAMIGGSMLPGAAGRFFGRLDPFSAGLSGFARGAGLRAGGMGIMANMGRIASGGVGSIARAGLAGVGGAFASAMPIYAAGKAISYGVGQAVQGAQFQNQVQGFLNQNFRFQNEQSRSGYGFSRDEGAQIAGMVREMGHSDMMTGPQELLRVMKGGAQMGLFRAVQDVKEFKKRFTDMVGSLKEVAQTMNTTLEGAMPFFSQARQMGFWTPTDITRHAQMARQTAGATGMSVAQTQQMMAQGTQMARSVGAMGYTGAMGMAQSMQLVGGGLRGGSINPYQLAEATGGLQGPEAIQSIAGTLQAATTRFASSNRARWVLAALGRNNFSSLDPGKLSDMSSGLMSLGEIGGGARRNIAQQGAFNFVNNEKTLRGELIRQGPAAQLGFVRTLIGGRLYGDDPKNKLITKRLMQRYFGVSGKQADIPTQLARDAPQIMRANEARGAAGVDQQERDREQMMERSWEGIKRKSSQWWDKNVKDPLQSYGASFSKAIGDFWERMSDKMWGDVPTRHRFRGIGGLGMEALQRSAMGDTRIMEQTFGKAGDFHKMFGAANQGLGTGAGLDIAGGGGGAFRSMRGLGAGAGMLNVAANVTGSGVLTNERIETLRRMGASEYAYNTQDERARAVREQGMMAGRYSGQIGHHAYRAFERAEVSKLTEGLAAAVTGRVTSQRQAAALGFESEKAATTAIESAQKEMSTSAYKLASSRLADATGKSGRDLAEAQVKAIMAGEMGSTALRKYVGGAKTMADRVHRLAAAQTPGMRGGVGGIDLVSEAKAIGLGAFTGLEDMEKQVGEAIEKAEAGLGKAISGGMDLGREGGIMDHIAPGRTALRTAVARAVMPAATPEVMESITKKGGDKFKRAMMLMSSGDSEEEKAANREKAKELLADLATDKQFSVTERTAIRAMQDDKHPNAAAIKAGVEQLGKTFKFKERAQFAEATMRRSARLFRNMGKQQNVIMGALDEIRAKGEAPGSQSIGSLVRDLRDTTDPETYQKKMEQIVALAGEADEAQISRAAEVLKGIGGGEHIVQALTGGREVGLMAKALTGKDTRRGTIAANMMLGGLLGRGKHVSPTQMKAIMGGGDQAEKVIAEVVKKAPEENRARIRELLEGISKKDMTTITKTARQQVLAQSLGTLADPKKNILLEGAKKLRGDVDVLGQLGSPKGMHAEMTRQSGFLQEIRDAVQKQAGIKPTKNPQENAGK